MFCTGEASWWSALCSLGCTPWRTESPCAYLQLCRTTGAIISSILHSHYNTQPHQRKSLLHYSRSAERLPVTRVMDVGPTLIHRVPVLSHLLFSSQLQPRALPHSLLSGKPVAKEWNPGKYTAFIRWQTIWLLIALDATPSGKQNATEGELK